MDLSLQRKGLSKLQSDRGGWALSSGDDCVSANGELMKRKFVREDDLLIDRYVTDGLFTVQFDESRIKLRATPVGDVARGHEVGFFVRANLESASATEEVLERLRSLEQRAPIEALLHLGVSGVREAILAASRLAPIQQLATYAQVLAVVGGAEAQAVLQQRRTDVFGESKLDEIAESWYPAIVNCAVARLALDSANMQAAGDLVGCIQLAESHARGFALARAAELARVVCGRGEGLELVRRTLESLAENISPDGFARIAPYLIIVRQKWVLERLDALVPSADSRVRLLLYSAMRLATPASVACSSLMRWLQWEPDIRLALDLISELHPLVDSAFAERMIRRALADPSPSLRLRSLDVMNAASLDARRELLQAAASEEPDAAILLVMRARIASLL